MQTLAKTSLLVFLCVGCSGPFEYVPADALPPGSGGASTVATTSPFVKPSAAGATNSTGGSSNQTGGTSALMTAGSSSAPVLDAGAGTSGGASLGTGGASFANGGSVGTGGDLGTGGSALILGTGGAAAAGTGGALGTGGTPPIPCTSAYTFGLCASTDPPAQPPPPAVHHETKCSVNATNCTDPAYPFWCVYRTCPQ